MNPKNFSLGIVDLLGIMFPGTIWFSLLYYLHVLNPDIFKDEFVKVGNQLAHDFPNNIFIINAFIFFIGSYLFGFLSRLVYPIWLDVLTLPIATLVGGTYKDNDNKNKNGKWKLRDKLRPFDFLFLHQSQQLMNLIPGLNKFSSNSKYFRLISICKRLIHEHSPSLWVETERREAEIRLINGLFYPFFLASIIFLFDTHRIVGYILALLTFFLAINFRRKRHQEVSFIYGVSFILINKLKRK